MASWLDEGRKKARKQADGALAEEEDYNDVGRRTGLKSNRVNDEIASAPTGGKLGELRERVNKLTNTSTKVEPRQVAAAAPPPVQEEPKKINKNSIYEALIGLGPMLVGAAVGGYDGGAIGGQVGANAVNKMDADRKSQEAIDRELAKEKKKDDLEQQKLQLDKQKLSSSERLRMATLESIKDRSEKSGERAQGDANAKHIRNLQTEFNKAIAKQEDAIQKVSDSRSIIASGSASDLQKVQLRLASIFNDGRPTDKDVLPFKGSTALLDKLERVVKAGTVNASTAMDRAELNRTLDILEATNRNRINDARRKYVKMGAVRHNVGEDVTERWLNGGGEAPTPTEEERAINRRKKIEAIKATYVEDED